MAAPTEKRYETHGAITTGATIEENLSALALPMAGNWIYTDGRFAPIAGASKASTTTVSFDDITSGIRTTVSRSKADRANRFIGTMRGPLANYVDTSYPAQEDSAAITADGEELVETLDQPMVSSVTQAQRVARAFLKRGRAFRTISFKTNLEGFALKAGDVFDFAEDPATVVGVGYWPAATLWRCTETRPTFSASGVELEVQAVEEDANAFAWSRTSDESLLPTTNQGSFLPSISDYTIPSFSATPYATNDERTVGYAVLSWDSLPLSLQGGVIELSWAPEAIGSFDWTYATVPGTATTFRVEGLNWAMTNYRFRARIKVFGRWSLYASSTDVGGSLGAAVVTRSLQSLVGNDDFRFGIVGWNQDETLDPDHFDDPLQATGNVLTLGDGGTDVLAQAAVSRAFPVKPGKHYTVKVRLKGVETASGTLAQYARAANLSLNFKTATPTGNFFADAANSEADYSLVCLNGGAAAAAQAESAMPLFGNEDTFVELTFSTRDPKNPFPSGGSAPTVGTWVNTFTWACVQLVCSPPPGADSARARLVVDFVEVVQEVEAGAVRTPTGSVVINDTEGSTLTRPVAVDGVTSTTLPPPSIDPVATTFDGASALSVSMVEPSGATVRYTLDGSEVTASSPEWPGGAGSYTTLSVAGTAQLRAKAFLSGRRSSEATGLYINTGTAESTTTTRVATPTITLNDTPGSATSATISTATSGATLEYNLNSGGWTSYTGAVSISTDDVLDARASKTSYLTSFVASVTNTAETPYDRVEL